MTTNNPTINILKISTCGKVTLPQEHTLTYNIGYNSDAEQLLIRVTDNATGGLFSSEWIAVEDAIKVIGERRKPDESFNANILAALFQSQSANNAGFLAAALKAEEILAPFKNAKRLHALGDTKVFTSNMAPFIKDKVSLQDVVAERNAAKAQAQAENERKLKAKRAKSAAKKPTK